MQWKRPGHHSTIKSDSNQPFAHPSSPSDTAEPQPTYVEVIEMINAAEQALKQQYAHIPKLRDELKLQFADGIEQCYLGEREPVVLLQARLRLERLTFDAYNRHRLNDSNNRDEDVQENLESFPLRLEVVQCGFPALTKDLLPIYLTTEHDVTDFVLEIPPAKKSQGPVSSTAQSTKNKTSRTVENYDKLGDAPRPNIAFPNTNILITEMAAFIPNAIKSCDIIDRVCGNGLGQHIYAIMINHYREMTRGKITANSTYRMFKGPISKRAKIEPDHEPSWDEWTPTVHAKYHDAATFDASSVSIAGFRTPADGKTKTSHAPIPMKALAVGVKTFPSGNDALDFTRVVSFAVDHPDENWMYPTDYSLILAKLGGPATVATAHTDAAVILRWNAAQQKTGRKTKNAGRKRDRKGRLQKVDSDDDDIDFASADETKYDPEGNDSNERDSEDDANDWMKAIKRKRDTFDDSDRHVDLDMSSCKSVKRGKLLLAPRAPRINRQSGKSMTHRSSRLPKESDASDIDSNSDGDNCHKSHKQKSKKTPVSEVRRSSRANKFTQSFVMTDDFEDEEDPGFDKSEMPDLISRYGTLASEKKVVERLNRP